MSATTTQLLSSGEFCKLRYDTIPIKSASANVSFYTSNPKITNVSFDNLVANERYKVLVCIIHTIMWPSRKKGKKMEGVNAAPSDLMSPLPPHASHCSQKAFRSIFFYHAVPGCRK